MCQKCVGNEDISEILLGGTESYVRFVFQEGDRLFNQLYNFSS